MGRVGKTCPLTFSTVLAVLVGDAGGPFAELCPIRLPAVATEKFTVTAEADTLLAVGRARRLAANPKRFELSLIVDQLASSALLTLYRESVLFLQSADRSCRVPRVRS
jgi:hypothetical protein